MKARKKDTSYTWLIIFAIFAVLMATFGLTSWQQNAMAISIVILSIMSLSTIFALGWLYKKFEEREEISEKRYKKWTDYEFIVREVSKKNPKLVMEVLEKAAIELDKHFRNQQTLLSLRERNEEQEAKLAKVTQSVNYEKDNFWRLVDAARSAGLDLKSMNSYRSFIRDAQF